MFSRFLKAPKQDSKKLKNLKTEEPKINSFHLTEDFICYGCYSTLEKEKSNNKRQNSSIYNNEEQLEDCDEDMNPEMEEEDKCVYCSKSSTISDATCLVKGQPSCIECALNFKKKPEVFSDFVRIEHITRLFSDNPIINISNSNEKAAKSVKKINEKEDSLSKSDNNSALVAELNSTKREEEKTSTKEIEHEREKERDREIFTVTRTNRKLTFKDIRTTVNFSNYIENNFGSEIQNIPHELDNKSVKSKFLNTSVSKPSLTSINDLTQKDINNKILNLVSPRTSIEFKYKRMNSTNRQIDKLCKSLDVIFNVQPGNKFTITLPILFQGPKFSKIEKNLFDTLQKNGNYLFYMSDVNLEFVCGLVWHCSTYDNKKIIKFFKNIKGQNIKIKTPEFSLLYDDDTYEEVSIKNNLILSENDFSFSMINYKLEIENLKLCKFLLNSIKRLSIEDISYLVIYDMC